MADKIRLGSAEIEHFADHIGRFDRAYLGNLQIYPKPAPTITNITPASGGGAGAFVTITGTTFFGTPTVTVGGQLATDVTVKSETVLTAQLPARSPGVVSLTVTTSAGTSNALPFQYLAQVSPMGMYLTTNMSFSTAFTRLAPMAALSTAPASQIVDNALVADGPGVRTIQARFDVPGNYMPTYRLMQNGNALGSGTTITVVDVTIASGDQFWLEARNGFGSGTVRGTAGETGTYLSWV